MQTFSPDDADRASLSEELGTAAVAINRYRLRPGEGLPGGLHTHLDQEEVFVVLDGTVRFETLAEPAVVDAGEAVRFAPGEYQTGANDGDSTAVVLAIGAPNGSDELWVPLDCPGCDHRAWLQSGPTARCCSRVRRVAASIEREGVPSVTARRCRSRPATRRGRPSSAAPTAGRNVPSRGGRS